jgi:RNA-directed DNA polymerase
MPGTFEGNLRDLHDRLRNHRYKAPPVERVWIDKEGGKKRPIGKPGFEDKVVQRACVMLLSPIYDHDFYDFSHGFRAGHSQHQALEELSRKCWELNVNWIVDADVSGFFDNLDHSILREFIQKRLNDGGIKRLIGKWLNAEVVDKGMWTRSEQGTPQRGGELTIASKYLSSLCVGRMVRKGRPIPYAGSLLSHSLRR